MQLAFLERYVDSANAFVYLKDEEGHFLMVNQFLADSVHKSKDELVGKTDYDIVAKHMADQFRKRDEEVRESGKPSDHEDTFTLGGHEYTVHDHKFPVSVEGHPHAVGGIAFVERMRH